MIVIESTNLDWRKQLERAPAFQPLIPRGEIAKIIKIDAL